MSNRYSSSKGSETLGAIIGVVLVFAIMGFIAEASIVRCAKAGCDNEVASGSKYCHLHRTYSSYSSSSRKSGSSSSSSKSSSGSSSSSKSTSSGSTSKSSSSSIKSSTSSKKSSTSAYDDGYEAIYEDDDYDIDRYYKDSDYASGVDDAMDDLDW